MQRRTRRIATTAGVNGDFFTFALGAPERRPDARGPGGEPAVGRALRARACTTDGTLDVRRVSFVGTWQGAGSSARSTQFNDRSPPPNGIALYTQAWGPTTPAVAGRDRGDPLPVPGARSRTPTSRHRWSRFAIGGAAGADPARAARCSSPVGAAAAALAAEAPVGQPVTLRLIFKPDWPGVVSAIGGGPQIVRDGARGLPRGRDRSRRASSARARRAPRSASSPTAGSSSSPSTDASPGTRSG